MNETRRSDAHVRPRRKRARMVFVFAAMLAVLLQAFAIQTHVHAFAAPAAVSAQQSADDGAATEHASAADHQTVCIICQALAANGSVTLVDAAHVAAQSNAAYQTAALEIRRAPRALAHSWQSRAPPIAA